MQDFDKQGEFYLGKEYDWQERKLKPELLLYDSRDLTTHAVCVGMTGSGKTGLCLALLEEAAIDGIPAIIIDPKGDLGNLLLTFPELRPKDFEPYLDEADAVRKGVTLDQLAEKTAATWKSGLADWGEDSARIAKFREAADIAIYTPGSDIGLPLTVLRSFSVPSQAVLDNAESLRERISAAVSGLLALVGVEADPLTSREHILLSNLLNQDWRAGKDVDLAGLVRQIQSPPLTTIGAVDLESFYPAKQRAELAKSLNNLLASPGFAGWLQGEPLDIQRLLWTEQAQTAAFDSVDRPSFRRRADVLRHHPAERNDQLDADAIGHIKPAQRCSTWTRCSATSPPRPIHRQRRRCSRCSSRLGPSA